MTDYAFFSTDKPVLSLAGPTAIGKTELSIGLAREFNCEIVSVDSMQVYRHMDIGTAKATPAERRMIRHHLIDIVNPDDEYNAARFVNDCLEAINSIQEKGAVPLLAGGTGLYFQALRHGLFSSPPIETAVRDALRLRVAEEGSRALHDDLMQHDPVSAQRIHPNDSTRIVRALEVFFSTGVPLSEYLRRQQEEEESSRFKHWLSLGLTCERETLYARINQRTGLLFEQGLEKEVKNLIEMGYGPDLQSMQSIGYRHMVRYLEGTWNLAECREHLARDTRRYAKRQYTWFNRDEQIKWFDRDDAEAIFSYVERNLFHHQQPSES